MNAPAFRYSEFTPNQHITSPAFAHNHVVILGVLLLGDRQEDSPDVLALG